jgi:hypothetical protein
MELSKPLADLKSYNYLMAGLESRQRIYVEARTNGSVPVVAARMAGYADPDAMAETLEKDLTVRTALEYSIRKLAHEVNVTRNDVINMMQDAFRVAATSGEMTAAAREIGKIIGAYAPIQIHTKSDVRVTQEKLREMTDEELARMAAIDGTAERVDDGEVPQTTD